MLFLQKGFGQRVRPSVDHAAAEPRTCRRVNALRLDSRPGTSSLPLGIILATSPTMKTLMSMIRVAAVLGCLTGLVTVSAGCETRERVVVRSRPPVERVYVRPVVEERVIVR
jgi:hypothetical protein